MNRHSDGCVSYVTFKVSTFGGCMYQFSPVSTRLLGSMFLSLSLETDHPSASNDPNCGAKRLALGLRIF